MGPSNRIPIFVGAACLLVKSTFLSNYHDVCWLYYCIFWVKAHPHPSVLATHIIANATPKGLEGLQRTILQEPYRLDCNEVTKMSLKKMGNNVNRPQRAFLQVVEFLKFVQNWITRKVGNNNSNNRQTHGFTCRCLDISYVFLQMFIQ